MKTKISLDFHICISVPLKDMSLTYFSISFTQGEYVYVNYAEIRDYQWLLENKVGLQGKIHIAKYGFTYRGEKVHLR